MATKSKDTNKIADTVEHDYNQSNNGAEKNRLNDVEILRKLLYKIWGLTEVLKSDVNYIKKIYTTPMDKNNKGVRKTERIAKLKHKLIASGKKFVKPHDLNE